MFKKSLVFISVLALVLGLVACGSDAPQEEVEEVQEEVEEVVEEVVEEEPEEEEEAEEEVSGLEFLDMAGRTVVIEEAAETVFATIPTATILLYTLNPDKMVGWNYDLSDGEKAYIDEKYHELPNLGGAGKEAVSVEELLKIDPDLLVMMEEVDEASAGKADELEEKFKKPVIVLDTSLDKMDEAYLILGPAMGEEAKAEELAAFCKKTIDEVQDNLDKIDEPRTVYYAEGEAGLMTEPEGSWHSEIIGMVGGKNAAETTVTENQGKTEVSMEQLLLWDPDLIISWDDARGGYYSGILEDGAWSSLKAVEEKEVFEIPNRPFNWFDRPPSVNRILGVRWMANLLYPEIFDYDIKEEVEEFYEKFYHYEFSGDELDELIKNAIRH